jgi:hypothetical protein
VRQLWALTCLVALEPEPLPASFDSDLRLVTRMIPAVRMTPAVKKNVDGTINTADSEITAGHPSTCLQLPYFGL